MELRQQKNADAVIFQLVGELNLYHSAELMDQVQNSISQETKSVILNLRALRSLDSSGIGALINLHSLTQEKRVSLCLVSVGESVHQSLRAARLEAFFQIVDTIEEATQRISK